METDEVGPMNVSHVAQNEGHQDGEEPRCTAGCQEGRDRDMVGDEKRNYKEAREEGDEEEKEKEQGRIHDCPCRGRLGRGSIELGRGRNELGRGINDHRILIPELIYLQTVQKRQKSKVGQTDGRTN